MPSRKGEKKVPLIFSLKFILISLITLCSLRRKKISEKKGTKSIMFHMENLQPILQVPKVIQKLSHFIEARLPFIYNSQKQKRTGKNKRKKSP